MPDSSAICLATMVLPVPGGPSRRTHSKFLLFFAIFFDEEMISSSCLRRTGLNMGRRGGLLPLAHDQIAPIRPDTGVCQAACFDSICMAGLPILALRTS